MHENNNFHEPEGCVCLLFAYPNGLLPYSRISTIGEYWVLSGSQKSFSWTLF